MPRRVALGLAWLAAPLWGLPVAAAVPPVEIRTDIVLRVGPAGISHYAVRKNVTRFRSSGSMPGAPSDEALRSWFEQYLCRQVMIAEALGQGYAERPEVVNVVETMERHMLAQSGMIPDPPTEPELRAAYEQAPVPPDRTKPAFEQMRPGIEQSLVQQRRATLLREQRARALQAVGLVLVPGTAARLLERLQAGPPMEMTIRADLVAAIAAEPLANYQLGSDPIVLTVESWRNLFNSQFVRSRPVAPAQLEANVQDMVVQEYASLEARRRGADREPQFVEDRRNFVYYQALELFEKEKLLPRIEITPQEAEAYYNGHPTEFVQPVRARGRLLRFRDFAVASTWMRTRDDALASVVEDIDVSPQAPIRGAERLMVPLLRAPDGRPFGPTRTASDVVVFLKQSTETGRPPFAEVAGQIRSKLAQLKLQDLEARLAREWAPRYVIEDRLQPEDFGVIGAIGKPWPVAK